jgi:hypothetical protein
LIENAPLFNVSSQITFHEMMSAISWQEQGTFDEMMAAISWQEQSTFDEMISAISWHELEGSLLSP